MAGKMKQRCLTCGKVFEIETRIDTVFMRNLFSEPPRASFFCPLCQAKINKESEETRKELKPM